MIEYRKSNVFDMIEVKTCTDDLHAYKCHVHQDLSVGFVQKGSTILNVNGTDYLIQAGEAIIIHPFVSHICRPVDLDNWAFTMIYIDRSFCEELLEKRQTPHSIGIKKLNKEEITEIKRLAEILKTSNDSFAQEVELTKVLSDLFDTVNIRIRFNHSQVMQDLCKYIESHFLDILQLDALETRFGINKFAMIRGFRSMFNTTPSAFQLQLKINYGKALLKQHKDIVKVALESGFYDQAHFTKEFKRSYGVTPLQYYKSIHCV